jgi:CheY-like chemotaxis protein
VYTIRQPLTKRVLIADDEDVSRYLLTRLVEKEGYEPVICKDGREVYRLLTLDANFCAAIFDKMMPHLDGLEIVRFMQTEKRLMRIPVMMISADQDIKLVGTSFAAGVTMFLPKPFTVDHFRSTFQLLLAHHSTNVCRRA